MEFKNWHLKGSKHTGLCSFLSPYHWRWIASHDLAVDRCIPLCLKTSGLSSRAEPLERLAVVWHAPCFLPAQQQQPARLPSFPAHLLACQPRCALWELGLAVLVTGLRWTADGAFCPSAPRGQVERVRETGVFMFHLLPHLLTRLCTHTCPGIDFCRKLEKIRKGERKTNHGGYGLEGNKGPWWCDGMKTSLIKSAQ